MLNNKTAIISTFVFIIASFILYLFFTVKANSSFVGFHSLDFNLEFFVLFCVSLIAPILIALLFFMIFPKKSLYFKPIKDIAFKNSLSFLFVFFLANAIAEELLFRGVLQENFGLLLASITFVLVHIAYYKKPILLLQVFLQGLFLGFLYEFSKSLILCILSHTFFNFFIVFIIKRKILVY